MQSFNLDMIMEILSRSSLETISKCRLLSKECNSLTYESFFRHLHSQRIKIVSGFLMQYDYFDKYCSEFVSTNEQPALSLDFLPSRVYIAASTNIGILLCINLVPRIHEYYVCKPSTKEYRKLPNPKTRYFMLAIGMVVVKSNPLHYKIIRISEPKSCRYGYSDYINLRTEIFDSETWSWKQVNAVSLHRDHFLFREPAISAGGSLYWSTSHHESIIAYHQEDNCCSSFSLPKEIGESRDFKLVEYEGRLAAVCDKEDLTELWIMRNDNGEKTWSRRMSISCEDVRKKERFANCVAFSGSDVALFSGFNKLMFYNLKKKTIEAVKGSSMDNKEFFKFQSDYEFVNFYSGKRGQVA